MNLRPSLTHNKIGLILLHHRKKNGFTQKRLAKVMGNISPFTISRFESGKHLPRIDQALQLANILGFKIQEFQKAWNTQE